MDYLFFCKSFFDATQIPVTLLHDGKAEYSTLSDILSIEPKPIEMPYQQERNPEFCTISPDIVYGRVKIEGTGYDMIIGPTFSVPPSKDVIDQFMLETGIPFARREEVEEALRAIPLTSHVRFCSLLVFLHQCLNQKECSIQELYTEDITVAENRNRRQIDSMAEDMENNELHNSYEFERELYRLIQSGNPQTLKRFFEQSHFSVKEGKMAQSPLRQAKNIFIGTATKAGMLGAIPGGVDVERVYQLIDLYVQECERLQRIDDIHELQYIMLMDFCRRSGEAHIPEGVSAEMFQCASYIRSHVSEPVSVADIAEHVHRSSSYVMKRFKEEFGMPIGAYITQCKLEEAESMLAHSSKSLADISLYLGFPANLIFKTCSSGGTASRRCSIGKTPANQKRITDAERNVRSASVIFTSGSFAFYVPFTKSGFPDFFSVFKAFRQCFSVR